jgi:uncharacterized protein (UPF0210 family)
MEIRSVTFLVDPQAGLDQVSAAGEAARVRFRQAGFALQTIRLATTPFSTWWQGPVGVSSLVDRCAAAGFDYVSIGPVLLDDDRSMLEDLPQMIGAHDQLFASAEIADSGGRIDIGRAREVAGVVRALSQVRPDGFSNLYFAATANCGPGSPFFPVSYHGGGPASFAIAVEAADLAVHAFQDAGSLSVARERLVRAIEREAARLVPVAERIQHDFDVAFGGIDFSLAPYPEAARSLGTAIEALGVPRVGGHGSVFAAAVLAECIDQAAFPRCGFSGLMFPVLEDATLARRAAEGFLTVNDLLLYSAVCGAGLDTIPLPGEASVEDLTALLLDLAALAVRLDKPLTARLMPLPGLEAGDRVSFDFAYFADSRVLALKGMGLEGTMSGPSRLGLLARPRRG